MMTTFTNSITSVLVILLLTAAGYFCAYRGYLNEAGKNMIAKLLLKLCIPCMIITSFQTNFTKESLGDAGFGILACFLIHIIMMLLSFLAMRIFKLERRQRGVFLTMSAFGNAMFVGYPMCMELFGDSCVKYVMVFYLAATTHIQLIGSGAIRLSNGTGSIFSRDTVKKLLTTPAIVTILVAILLMLLNVKLPAFVLSATKYLSNCVTPLALIVTGYILYSIGIKSLRFDRNLTVTMIFRFILSPAVALLVCRFFHIDGLFRSVIVVESAMPAPSQTVVFASEYGADDELAARGCSLSTLLSFVEIPLLMLLLNVL